MGNGLHHDLQLLDDQDLTHALRLNNKLNWIPPLKLLASWYWLFYFVSKYIAFCSAFEKLSYS